MNIEEIHIATTECLQLRRVEIENTLQFKIFKGDENELLEQEHGLIIEELAQRGALEKEEFELSQPPTASPLQMAARGAALAIWDSLCARTGFGFKDLALYEPTGFAKLTKWHTKLIYDHMAALIKGLRVEDEPKPAPQPESVAPMNPDGTWRDWVVTRNIEQPERCQCICNKGGNEFQGGPWQCGLNADHDGDHSALSASDSPWAISEYEQYKAQKEDILRRQRKQSESEAVGLLRALSEGIQSKTLTMHTMLSKEADSLYALTVEIDKFLSRPPAPNWQALLRNLVTALKRYLEADAEVSRLLPEQDLPEGFDAEAFDKAHTEQMVSHLALIETLRLIPEVCSDALTTESPGHDWRKLGENTVTTNDALVDYLKLVGGNGDLEQFKQLDNARHAAMEELRVALASESTAGKGGE